MLCCNSTLYFTDNTEKYSVFVEIMLQCDMTAAKIDVDGICPISIYLHFQTCWLIMQKIARSFLEQVHVLTAQGVNSFPISWGSKKSLNLLHPCSPVKCSIINQLITVDRTTVKRYATLWQP